MKRIISVILTALFVLSSAVMFISAEEVKNPFADVKAKDWFYADVMSAVECGLMKGITDTEFQPKGNMTRAQVVTILARLAIRKEKLTEEELARYDRESQFSDIKKGKWYTKEVNWAADKSLVNGYEDGTFKPDNSVTRQELAKLIMGLVNYLEVEIPDASGTGGRFKDAKLIQSWAKPFVDEMKKKGLIKGDDAGNFNPTKTASRAEVTTIAVRLYPYTAPVLSPEILMNQYLDKYVCVTHGHINVVGGRTATITKEWLEECIIKWMGLDPERYEVTVDDDFLDTGIDDYSGQGEGCGARFETYLVLTDKETGESYETDDVVAFNIDKYFDAPGEKYVCQEDFQEADYLHNLDTYLTKNDKGQYIVSIGEYNADTLWTDISDYVIGAFGLSPKMFELVLIDENELAVKMTDRKLFEDEDEDVLEGARTAYNDMAKAFGSSVSAQGGSIKVKVGILDNLQYVFSKMSFQKKPIKSDLVEIEFAVNFGK